MANTLCEVCGCVMQESESCECGCDVCDNCKTKDGKCYHCAGDDNVD
jgi:hypothetical protein